MNLQLRGSDGSLTLLIYSVREHKDVLEPQWPVKLIKLKEPSDKKRCLSKNVYNDNWYTQLSISPFFCFLIFNDS